MTTRNAIRQQNAERRLSHARWEHERESLSRDIKSLWLGVGIGLFVVIFFAYRY